MDDFFSFYEPPLNEDDTVETDDDHPDEPPSLTPPDTDHLGWLAGSIARSCEAAGLVSESAAPTPTIGEPNLTSSPRLDFDATGWNGNQGVGFGGSFGSGFSGSFGGNF